MHAHLVPLMKDACTCWWQWRKAVTDNSACYWIGFTTFKPSDKAARSHLLMTAAPSLLSRSTVTLLVSMTQSLEVRALQSAFVAAVLYRLQLAKHHIVCLLGQLVGYECLGAPQHNTTQKLTKFSLTLTPLYNHTKTNMFNCRDNYLYEKMFICFLKKQLNFSKMLFEEDSICLRLLYRTDVLLMKQDKHNTYAGTLC